MTAPRVQRATLVPAETTRAAILHAVEKATAMRFDGPGLTWRGNLMAQVLHEIAEAGVLYPSQENAVRALSEFLVLEAGENLDDEWPS